MATGTVMPMPKYSAFDNNGDPLVGGLLFVYAAGTSTPATTYADVDLLVPNTNPIVLDAGGRATVFLAAGSYKFEQRTSIATGATLVWTQDNITATGSGGGGGGGADIIATGVAGEDLLADELCFLAIGLDGTVNGRWFKTDSDFPSKSTEAYTVGFAVSDTPLGATGTFRIYGQMSFLSPLALGSPYFAGATPGTIVNVPPANARFIGQANTTNSLIVGTVQGGSAAGGGGGLDYLQLQVFA